MSSEYTGIVEALQIDRNSSPAAALFRLAKADGARVLVAVANTANFPNLKNGATATVRGDADADGTVRAGSIRIGDGQPVEKAAAEPVLMTGTASRITPGNPGMVRFWLLLPQGQTVRAQAPASFAAALGVGNEVTVRGVIDDEGLLQASQVIPVGGQPAPAPASGKPAVAPASPPPPKSAGEFKLPGDAKRQWGPKVTYRVLQLGEAKQRRFLKAYVDLRTALGVTALVIIGYVLLIPGLISLAIGIKDSYLDVRGNPGSDARMTGSIALICGVILLFLGLMRRANLRREIAQSLLDSDEFTRDV